MHSEVRSGEPTFMRHIVSVIDDNLWVGCDFENSNTDFGSSNFGSSSLVL